MQKIYIQNIQTKYNIDIIGLSTTTTPNNLITYFFLKTTCFMYEIV